MNHRIDKILTPKGEIRHEVRVWDRGRHARQIKRRFKSKKDLLNFIDELKKEEASMLVGFEGLFGDEYRYWRKNKADNDFAPGWLANLDGYWSEMEHILSGVKLSNINHHLLKQIENALLKQGNARKTVNNKMGFILATLNFAVTSKRIPFNPLGKYKLPKPDSEDIEFLEQAEAISFLDFLNDKYPRADKERWRYAACLVVLNTGLRAGELWALRPNCLKKLKSIIRISEQYNRAIKEFRVLKGKEPRSVPLNTLLLAELDFLITEKKMKSGELIFTRNRKAIDHDVFMETFNEDVKAWGVRRITFHGLRHTAATLMLNSGVNVKDLKEIMGHKNIATTMKYVHLIGDNVKSVAARFSVSPERKMQND